jgi:hypothetical protein
MKLVYFLSCIATKLGGKAGFSLMMKKKGTAAIVIQRFYASKSLFSAL